MDNGEHNSLPVTGSNECMSNTMVIEMQQGNYIL